MCVAGGAGVRIMQEQGSAEEDHITGSLWTLQNSLMEHLISFFFKNHKKYYYCFLVLLL